MTSDIVDIEEIINEFPELSDKIAVSTGLVSGFCYALQSFRGCAHLEDDEKEQLFVSIMQEKVEYLTEKMDILIAKETGLDNVISEGVKSLDEAKRGRGPANPN